MPKRKITIGWGPKEDAPHYVDLAFRLYGKDGNPATLILTMHPAESVSNAGFRSAMFIRDNPNLSFPHQVGEMFGFLGSFLGVLVAAEEEFVGIIFVNHLPRQPSGTPSTRNRQEITTTAEGVKRFCQLVSKSLTTGTDAWSSPECDWVYLNCEAAVD